MGVALATVRGDAAGRMTQSKDPRRVLITGTSSGFGYGATKALAARGHTVFATMRGVDGKHRGMADELRAWAEQGKHSVHVIELDVTDDASVQAGVTRALELGGGIDTLINNAGIGIFGLHETFSPAQLASALDVNVVGTFRVTRAVLPLMREAKAGHIVFLGSTLGRVILPFMGPYTATKFAVEGMAECIAFEVAPLGIDVTIIEPGAYGTDFVPKGLQPADFGRLEQYGPVKDAMFGFFKAFQEMAAAGQIGDPKEIFETFVRVTELPKGERPLRLSVDAQLGQAVTAINQTCAQMQQSVMAGMGFGDWGKK
jgi:NAD(P)-dependent dehydrogenase (short-subunit alcohol dehydrogenase family)